MRRTILPCTFHVQRTALAARESTPANTPRRAPQSRQQARTHCRMPMRRLHDEARHRRSDHAGQIRQQMHEAAHSADVSRAARCPESRPNRPRPSHTGRRSTPTSARPRPVCWRRVRPTPTHTAAAPRHTDSTSLRDSNGLPVNRKIKSEMKPPAASPMLPSSHGITVANAHVVQAQVMRFGQICRKPRQEEEQHVVVGEEGEGRGENDRLASGRTVSPSLLAVGRMRHRRCSSAGRRRSIRAPPVSRGCSAAVVRSWSTSTPRATAAPAP